MQLFYTYFVLVSIQFCCLESFLLDPFAFVRRPTKPSSHTSQFGTKSTLIVCLFLCLFVSFFLHSFAYCRLKRDSLSYSHHLTSWLLYAHCLSCTTKREYNNCITLNQSSVGADSFHLSWSLFFVSHCIIFAKQTLYYFCILKSLSRWSSPIYLTRSVTSLKNTSTEDDDD